MPGRPKVKLRRNQRAHDPPESAGIGPVRIKGLGGRSGRDLTAVLESASSRPRQSPLISIWLIFFAFWVSHQSVDLLGLRHIRKVFLAFKKQPLNIAACQLDTSHQTRLAEADNLATPDRSRRHQELPRDIRLGARSSPSLRPAPRIFCRPLTIGCCGGASLILGAQVQCRDFRYWHETDTPKRSLDVCSWGQNGYPAAKSQCPSLTDAVENVFWG